MGEEGDELSVALTVLRLVSGLKQEELARAAGIRAGTVSDYERGKLTPGLKTLGRLADALGFSLAAVDEVQEFIRLLRSWRSLGMLPSEEPQSCDKEVERVANQLGEAMSSLVRLFFRGQRAGSTEEEKQQEG